MVNQSTKIYTTDSKNDDVDVDEDDDDDEEDVESMLQRFLFFVQCLDRFQLLGKRRTTEMDINRERWYIMKTN